MPLKICQVADLDWSDMENTKQAFPALPSNKQSGKQHLLDVADSTVAFCWICCCTVQGNLAEEIGIPSLNFYLFPTVSDSPPLWCLTLRRGHNNNNSMNVNVFFLLFTVCEIVC